MGPRRYRVACYMAFNWFRTTAMTRADEIHVLLGASNIFSSFQSSSWLLYPKVKRLFQFDLDLLTKSPLF